MKRSFIVFSSISCLSLAVVFSASNGRSEAIPFSAFRQQSPLVTTNWLTAVPAFRDVNGHLYNTDRSVLWENFHGDILEVLTNGLLIQTFYMKPVYQASTTSVPVHNYLGGIVGYRTIPTTVQVDTTKISDKTFLLRNYPLKLESTVGQEISFRAMQIGTIAHGGNILQLWDYGTPHMIMVITTNYPHAFQTREENRQK